ncbi:usherin isoform X1 [Sigmodon hispidus]
MFSYTPTSVIVSWKPPTNPNGLVGNFTIQRRVKGKEEVRNLITLPKSHAMKFIDNDPALSPWTQYEYRVLGSLRGDTRSSEWVEVITRPSRPAGVQPPRVHVLGPDSVKVTWRAPLIQNGDILSYEIRMPDPLITIANVTPVVFSHLIKHLTPFTDYSVTIVACSGGNGYLGGCTESLPTSVTTHPALPQELAPLSASPLRESYVRISWQPPSKPNGPNLRYELLRRKIQQPLASNPPEDLNLWHNIYSGTQWFYRDKSLSRFTTYGYKLFVYNSVGFTPSQEVTVTTLAGFPERGVNVTASILNHTAIDVRWKKPTLQDLQGDVEYYTLFWSSGILNKSMKIFPDVDSHVIDTLAPNTEYQILLSVFNGVHEINSTVVHVTTCDEEPRGMLPPEVVIINSTAVHVIWTSPSSPNGTVTKSSVYVNNKLYKTGMDVPGSFILRGLSPFTIYDIQVEVCTENTCVKSNGTQVSIAEDTPSDISIPIIHDITSRRLPGRKIQPIRLYFCDISSKPVVSLEAADSDDPSLDTSTAKMVNVPKTRRTFCKKYGKHQPHRVTQYKKGKNSQYAQGKQRYDRKQSGCGGQTKQIFRKKAKTTKKIVLRLECVELNCRSKRMLAIKRCKHFELGEDKKRKGQVIQF